MPDIVTASQLRAVLGVSSSLYSDATLDEIIDSAEAVILPMLTAYTAGVAQYELIDNELHFYTIRPHRFVVGQSVIIAGVSESIDGTYTVTNDKLSAYVFSVAKVASDVTLRAVIPSASATLSGASAADLYAGVPAIETAIIATSTEIFQNRTSAGNAIDGVDFQVTPYRMGRQLVQRISSLLVPYVEVETMVQ
jgi:hypothetical protein